MLCIVHQPDAASGHGSCYGIVIKAMLKIRISTSEFFYWFSTSAMYYFIEPKYLLKGAEYDCHSLSSHVDVFGPCKKIGNSVQHYCHYILPAAFLACMRVVFFSTMELKNFGKGEQEIIKWMLWSQVIGLYEMRVYFCSKMPTHKWCVWNGRYNLNC